MKMTKTVASIILAAVVILLMPLTAYAGYIAEIGLEQDTDGYYLVNTYDEVKEAFNSYEHDKKIRLNADILQEDSLNENYIYPRENVMLDLNGHTLSRTGYFVDNALFKIGTNAKLTIEDSSGTNSGVCEFHNSVVQSYVMFMLYDGGELEINGGTFKMDSKVSTYCIYLARRSDKAILNGGVFDGSRYCVYADRLSCELGGRLDINGGIYRCEYMCISMTSSGVLNTAAIVRGGEFYSEEGYFANGEFYGNVFVFAGKMMKKTLNANGMYIADGARKRSLTVDGQAYYNVEMPAYITSPHLSLDDRIADAAQRMLYNTSKYEITHNYSAEDVNAMEQYLNTPCEMTVYKNEVFTTLTTENLPDAEYTVHWYVSDTPDADDTDWEYIGSGKSFSPERPSEACVKYYKTSVIIPSESYVFEDKIKVNYEEYVPQINGNIYIKGGANYLNTVSVGINAIQTNGGTLDYKWYVSGSFVSSAETFTINKEDMIGKRIKCVVSSRKAEGCIQTPELIIAGKENNDEPKLPKLSLELSSGGNVERVYFHDISGYQEYLITSSPTADGTENFRYISQPYLTLDELESGYGIKSGGTLYVHTRFKSAGTVAAGSIIRHTSVKLSGTVYLNGIDIEGVQNNMLYIPFTNAGDIYTIKYSFNPTNANSFNSFRWSSSNTYAFSVEEPTGSVTYESDTGEVKIKLNNIGGSTLKASYQTNTENQYASVNVVLYDPQDVGINVLRATGSPSDKKLYEGEMLELPQIELLPEKPDKFTYGWYINYRENAYSQTQRLTENSYMSIDPATGVVTGKAAGKTSVGYYAMDGVNAKEIASIYVEVLPADENTVSVGSVSLSTDCIDMKTNESFNLYAWVYPANATDQTVTWSSDDTSVVSVDQNGRVTAHNVGDAVITATAVGGKQADCLVNVEPVSVVPYIIGDIDLNYKINKVDAAKLLKYISGTGELTTEEYTVAFVNDDNTIDMLDVIAILNMAS